MGIPLQNNTNVNPGPGPPGPGPSPGPSGLLRFFNGFEWRFIVTDLNLRTTTWANDLWKERQILKQLNQASTITAAVDPDDFRVNGVFDDFYRRIAQSNRILWAWRRDGVTAPYWNLREAGIIMSVDDAADTDVPLSRVTAYNPWKLLEGRPVMDQFGQLPPSGGSVQGLQLGAISGMPTGDLIALNVLARTIQFEGGVFIDAGQVWGGSTSYAGTLETCPNMEMTANAGMSVADVWNSLVSSGNMDIVLKPIWDPARKVLDPFTGNWNYFTHELSIYNLAGQYRPNARFAWDRLNRSTSTIERLHDATPGSFFDKVVYFVGQGGSATPTITNPAAIAAFGNYWTTQFFPQESNITLDGPLTLALAHQALELAKQGARTVTITTVPELAPIPLLGYDVYDFVPVYASDRIRAPIDGYMRVQTVPISIDDNGIETVRGLILSPDWRGSVDPPPGGAPSAGRVVTNTQALQTILARRFMTGRTGSGLGG